MKIQPKYFEVKGLSYTILSAEASDAAEMSELRVRIDGETENLDREPGEAFIGPAGFEEVIQTDTERANHLFLVAVARGRLAGYSHCEGSGLKRLAHKVEFGVGVLEEFWGHAIGTHLLKESISWADTSGIRKMTLSVLETNEKAVQLYEKLGFEVEGILKNDKRLSDGQFYNTVVMGRFI